MTTFGLYLHIPFCHARCGYCDFATTVGQEDKMEATLKALVTEIGWHQGKKIDTLFIGGGTPTVLSPSQIHFLLNAIHSNLDTSELVEATIEANPESATADVLSAYKEGGINRISFGLQATQNRLLAKLDRLHSWDDFLTAWGAAGEVGFQNRNVDLMFGLPGQSMRDWEETLSTVIGLSPDHLSLYALKVEPGTPFYKTHVDVDGDTQSDMYMLASDKLSQAGYGHYEISNFAKPGMASRHNLKYWENQPTIGVGVSAAGFSDGKRRTNTRNLTAYIESIQKGNSPEVEQSDLNPDQQFREDLMLGLRLHKGVPWSELEKIAIPLTQTFLQKGLASLQNGRYSLTPKGWLLSNQLFEHLV